MVVVVVVSSSSSSSNIALKRLTKAPPTVALLTMAGAYYGPTYRGPSHHGSSHYDGFSHQVVGSAIALKLLFGLPLWAGCLVTVLDTLTFLP